MTHTIEKVMVFKTAAELPSAYKYLGAYAPAPGRVCAVVKQSTSGAEVYLTVKYNGQQSTHSARLFRTVAANTARQKLIAAGASSKLIARL